LHKTTTTYIPLDFQISKRFAKAIKMLQMLHPVQKYGQLAFAKHLIHAVDGALQNTRQKRQEFFWVNRPRLVLVLRKEAVAETAEFLVSDHGSAHQEVKQRD